MRSEKKKLADGNGAESRACFFRFGSADHVLDQVVHHLGLDDDPPRCWVMTTNPVSGDHVLDQPPRQLARPRSPSPPPPRGLGMAGHAAEFAAQHLHHDGHGHLVNVDGVTMGGGGAGHMGSGAGAGGGEMDHHCLEHAIVGASPARERELAARAQSKEKPAFRVASVDNGVRMRNTDVFVLSNVGPKRGYAYETRAVWKVTWHTFPSYTGCLPAVNMEPPTAHWTGT